MERKSTQSTHVRQTVLNSVNHSEPGQSGGWVIKWASIMQGRAASSLKGGCDPWSVNVWCRPVYADTGTKDEPIQLFYSNIHTSPLRDNDADSHLALLSSPCLDNSSRLLHVSYTTLCLHVVRLKCAHFLIKQYLVQEYVLQWAQNILSLLQI